MSPTPGASGACSRCHQRAPAPGRRCCAECLAAASARMSELRQQRREDPLLRLAARLDSAARAVRRDWPAAPADLIPGLIVAAGHLDRLTHALAVR